MATYARKNLAMKRYIMYSLKQRISVDLSVEKGCAYTYWLMIAMKDVETSSGLETERELNVLTRRALNSQLSLSSLTHRRAHQI